MDFKHLLASQNDVFGLDIGSSCVKIAALHHDENGYTLISAGKTEVKSNDSKYSTAANISIAIGKCFKSVGLKTKYAVCGICGPDVATRRFRFPVLSNEEIADAVLFEAEQVCPFDSGQFIVDYQVINYGSNDEVEEQEHGGETNGVLAAAIPETIRKRSQLVRAASLNCVLMDVDGVALSNCFSSLERTEQPGTIAILDIGSIFTNLVIMGSDNFPFVRDIQHAGNEIINNICKEHDVSPEVVHDSLCRPKNEKDDNNRFMADLEKACTELISGIQETLRYCEVHDACVIEKIFVCGGFGMVDGLVDLLDSHLKSQVVLWNPLAKINVDSGINDKRIISEQGPSLALAVGLAMRSI